jgi:DNA repair ATPase RecN
MKIKKLIINNIGIIGNETIEFNKSLNLFYGDVRQGKTTILNAIKWCFGGRFPDDIIKHGEKKASIELHFDSTYIVRKFRKDKHGATKSDKIEFIDEDGEEVDKPVDAIKKFINPFLLNQNHLIDMNEPSRQRFFMELFDIDTESLDKELKQAEEAAKGLRIKIGAYGDLQGEKIEEVNIVTLQAKRNLIISEFKKNHEKDIENNTQIIKINNERIRGKEKIIELQEEINTIVQKQKEIQTWVDKNPEQTTKDIPSQANTDDIDNKINTGIRQNVLYEQYHKEELQRSRKAEDQDTLTDLEESIRDMRKDKAGCLSEVNKKCTIKGLVFDDFGNFEFEETTAGMLSTSQLMRLSSSLSKLYPEGFGLELIDRGESIGKDIFLFVDKAKAEKKTILATIVGEKPAEVPADIGVFVVDKGEIK